MVTNGYLPLLHTAVYVLVIVSVTVVEALSKADLAYASISESVAKSVWPNPPYYSFLFQRILPLPAVQINVTVLNGNISVSPSNSNTTGIPTVNDAFALIEKGIFLNASILAAVFDDTLGYPREITVQNTPSSTETHWIMQSLTVLTLPATVSTATKTTTGAVGTTIGTTKTASIMNITTTDITNTAFSSIVETNSSTDTPTISTTISTTTPSSSSSSSSSPPPSSPYPIIPPPSLPTKPSSTRTPTPTSIAVTTVQPSIDKYDDWGNIDQAVIGYSSQDVIVSLIPNALILSQKYLYDFTNQLTLTLLSLPSTPLLFLNGTTIPIGQAFTANTNVLFRTKASITSSYETSWMFNLTVLSNDNAGINDGDGDGGSGSGSTDGDGGDTVNGPTTSMPPAKQSWTSTLRYQGHANIRFKALVLPSSTAVPTTTISGFGLFSAQVLLAGIVTSSFDATTRRNFVNALCLLHDSLSPNNIIINKISSATLVYSRTSRSISSGVSILFSVLSDVSSATDIFSIFTNSSSTTLTQSLAQVSFSPSVAVFSLKTSSTTVIRAPGPQLLSLTPSINSTLDSLLFSVSTTYSEPVLLPILNFATVIFVPLDNPDMATSISSSQLQISSNGNTATISFGYAASITQAGWYQLIFSDPFFVSASTGNAAETPKSWTFYANESAVPVLPMMGAPPPPSIPIQNINTNATRHNNSGTIIALPNDDDEDHHGGRDSATLVNLNAKSYTNIVVAIVLCSIFGAILAVWLAYRGYTSAKMIKASRKNIKKALPTVLNGVGPQQQPQPPSPKQQQQQQQPSPHQLREIHVDKYLDHHSDTVKYGHEDVFVANSP